MLTNTNRYPNVPGARKGVPETSIEAAGSMRFIAPTRRSLILAYLTDMAEYGAIADEVEKAFDWPRQSSMPRLAELGAAGFIAKNGATRRGKSGRRQAVWVLKRYAPGFSDNSQRATTAM
jgi:hypothetical protein